MTTSEINDSKSVFARPDYTLPAISLRFVCHLECEMESFTEVGDGPYGKRMNVIFKGGVFEGPSFKGEVLPGGGDWEIVQPDGTALLDTRYNLRTHDGAVIYIQTSGVRTGKSEILAKLGDDESIKASEYRMRLNVKMETGDARYKEWINAGAFVASAGRSGNRVVYDLFELC